jgi:hypothetical protein
MEDRDFIAQMAQFSALEQMVQMNATMERSQAFGMIGQIIDAEFFNPHSEEWVEIEGRRVLSVTRQGDRVFLTVMGEDGMFVDVPFDAVREISEDFWVPQQLQEIFASVNAQRAEDLIGRFVQALSVNGDNVEFIEGRVDSVKLAGDVAVLVIGNREVFLNEVHSVANNYQLLHSTHFTNGDRVTGVQIRDNRAYLVFDYNTTDRVRVNRINYATEALVYVDRYIRDGSIEGRVVDITLRSGIPWLNVRRADGTMGQVDFLNYLVNRSEGTSTSWAGPPPASDTGNDPDGSGA